MGKPLVFQGGTVKSVIGVIALFLSASTSFALEADFTGYLRGGTGVNFQGGRQQCFNNAGIPGNFMRLGNECSFYSEIGMVFHHKKAEAADSVYFRTQTRLMLGAQGTRQWEAAANRDINQIEAFVLAGGFSEVPGEFWVGKRFYRDVDVHIFDWYYYAEMSGVGGGVDNIPLGPGQFAIAHLIQAESDSPTVVTSTGLPVLQALDLRWKALPVGFEQNLNLWAVYAFADASKTGSAEYIPTNGFSLAARLNGKLFSGNNNFSVLYGKGTMKDLNIYASSRVPSTDDSQNKAWTLRVVEDWHVDVSDKWALIVSAAAEVADNGQSTLSASQWQAVGVRPTYFISDRFQMVFEAGYSHIKKDAESDAGQPVGSRELSRVTIAPQLSLSKSIWGRPVMRAFVSHSMWSKSNKIFIGATNANPNFLNETAGTNFGYQFEAWF